MTRPRKPSAAPEFYGTQPSELPETLPIGTHCKYGYSSTSALELRDTSAYWGDWSNGALGAWVSASSIDWSLVPRAKTPEASGGVAKAADPYAEHRLAVQSGEFKARELSPGRMRIANAKLVAVEGLTGDELDAALDKNRREHRRVDGDWSLALKRKKQVGTLLGEMDSGKSRRASVSAHPKSFPEGAHWDAQECYSTTGSRGGR